MPVGDRGAKHGTRSMYVKGCRCEPCSVVNAEYQRDYMYAHYPSTKRLKPGYYKHKVKR